MPVIITVPASFQSAQRRDTVHAAQMAGFRLSEHCLFDEPNAALLAYVNRHRVQSRWDIEETVLVFDFGGGTCDISIIDIGFAPVNQTLQLRNRAISRFEKLGGDDMDKHFVHEHLAKLFYETTGRDVFEWSYQERRDRIWSQLAKVAEVLKTRLCDELDKEVQAKGWTLDLSTVRVSLPPQLIHTSRRDVYLGDLTIDARTFSDMVRPFLDPEGTNDKEGEHYSITSIFTPIRDALGKAGLEPDDITRVLLVGGSSRNPLVEHAIKKYFREATIIVVPGI